MVTMKAALQDRYGAPDVLKETIIECPVPTANEVLVRITAASVNGYDVLLRSGALKMMAGRSFPKQTGLDFVGTIAEAFAGSPLQVGDAVWGVLPLHRLGGIAEYVAIAPKYLALRPTSLTDIEAAALPVVGATALSALQDVARLRPGERLLVRGASGGVGSMAVQIGKAMGAHVTGLASAPDRAFVHALGADDVIDHVGLDPSSLGQFDVILDTVGVDTRAYRRLLAKGGRMAAIVPDPRHPVLWMAYVAFSRVHGGRRVRYFNVAPDAAMLATLTRYVEDGAVKPIIAGVYSLACIADAHRAFETRGKRGKQVISLAKACAPTGESA